MTNVERARELIARVRATGVEEFCVCAGSRNSPLLAVLGAAGLRLFSFVDERSAAFFALGRIKLHGAPVAVVTTSGTAVAELLPATVEAFYSQLPLMLITADRPARYRGTGAPQCIEQEGIFGAYATTDVDAWPGTAPLHVNIEFDEPLIDGKVRGARAGATPLIRPSATFSPRAGRRLFDFRHPLLILGGLAPGDRDRVREFLLQLRAPVYAEPLSGLREDARLERLMITAGERMIGLGTFDGVIRVGNVPAIRFWRDLDESKREIPVVSFSGSPFAGASRGELHPLEALPVAKPAKRDAAFFKRDRAMAAKIESILDDEPESEPSIFRQLSRELPKGARVYLGNSLPIREWDLFASREPRGYVYQANRGANGIDGQLSTYFGWCAPRQENVAVLGDLTVLYDMNAPWIVPQLDRGVRVKIVIINNGGGRIFSRVASLKQIDSAVRERIIENSHSFRFASWASMWRLGSSVLELLPDPEATRRVWERYDALWS
ncbi:MAG TPA: thiamine pyrophosphate-binding protein [Thermoanaerobaculia bacterium]|nr:thiamine pyrophosphate-binding protein [Thermoanaerobaculia bacterium]